MIRKKSVNFIRPAKTMMEDLKLRRVEKTEDWMELRELNRQILRITYDSEFYDTMMIKNNQYAFILCGLNREVGAFSFEVSQNTAYVFTFGIVESLRGIGLGRKAWVMVEDLLKSVYSCTKVVLHVQQSSMEAVRFYKQQGFDIIELIEDYYEGLVCNAAYLLNKDI